jgi:membrane protein implicated in regulation of membrane protease activity
MSADRTRLPTGTIATAAVLLAIPVLALLIVPIYASEDPHLWGFPFFYWYQLAWVFLASLLTYIAYRLVRGTDRTRARLTDRSER